LMRPSELTEANWHIVNSKLLKDIGLNNQEYIVVWLLIDSFVTRTDRNKSSSLVLGELFDIGLKFTNCIKKSVHDLQIVTDMMRMIRMNKEEDFSLMIRKGRKRLPYCVYLSDHAKKILKEYVNKFPQVVRYILKNPKWRTDFEKIPQDHEVQLMTNLGQKNL